MKATVVLMIALAATLEGTNTGVASQVREIYHGKSGKQVYILEDIHGNYQAQLGHVKVLTQLINKNGLQLVATEGAMGYLSSLPLETGSRAPAERLAAANTLLQNNQLNAAYLIQAIAKQRLTVVGVENKKSYALHLEIAQEIAHRNVGVKEELSKIAAVAKNPGNKALQKELAYFEKAFSLKINRTVVQDWKKNSLRGRLSRWLDSLPAELKINRPLLERQASDVEKYYRIALNRDATLAENTLSRMELEQKESAALIVGGFHTQGITEILRQNGVSYTVLTPE